MRLAKFLAHAGVASRRGAEEIIRDGRVTIGDRIVTDPARDVDVDSGVAVDGKFLEGVEERMVFVVHKPSGVLSTARDTHGRWSAAVAIDQMSLPPSVHAVIGGRVGRHGAEAETGF